jgi:hypothetical protein
MSKGRDMSGFVQIIQMRTSRIDEVRQLVEDMREKRQAQGDDANMPVRATSGEDRDHPGTYISIVEFDSHEAAMANSNNPLTAEMAKKMAELCDGPPTFINVEVQMTM